MTDRSRKSFAATLILFFTTVGVLRAADPPGPESRNAWRYRTAGRTGHFVKEADQGWVETSADGDEFRFEESRRVADHVELFDASRDMHLRLYADHAEWSQGDQSRWYRLYDGHWVAANHAALPPKSDHRIRLVYFVPTDREPTLEFARKIRVVMQVVAEVYRQDFTSRGIASKGLQFQMEAGEPIVHLVRGKHAAAFYNAAPNYERNDQFDKVKAEIPAAVGVPSRNVMIVFAETYDPGPAEWEWPGGVALGARFSADGGFALFSAWILRPEFCATTLEAQKKMLWDKTPIPGRIALGNGHPGSPRFEFIEDGFGAVAHELGHALGLPHDQRQSDRDIMGNGFRNLRWNFAPQPNPNRTARFSDDNARILYTSRYLAPAAVLSDRRPPHIQLKWARPPHAGDKSVSVGVTATDNEGLRAIVFYTAAQDSVIGGRELSGKAQSFELTMKVDPLKKGTYNVEAFLADAGGQLTRSELKTNVEE